MVLLVMALLLAELLRLLSCSHLNRQKFLGQSFVPGVSVSDRIRESEAAWARKTALEKNKMMEAIELGQQHEVFLVHLDLREACWVRL